MERFFHSAIKQFASLLAWIGVLVGVLSAVSAINHLWEIGIGGFFADCVAFYRQMMSPLYDLLKRMPLPFSVPDFVFDIAALYFVLFSMSLRASIIPLSDKDYYHEERMKDAEYWTVHQGSLTEPLEDNLMYAHQNPDGTYTKTLYQLKAPWLTIARSLALAASLWPVITLAPARKLILTQYVFRSDGKDQGPLIKFDGAVVSKKYLRLTKMKLFLAGQIILLPVGVVLFYVLANFNPLGSS